jgi:peptide/nickel transport system ATP-binding protein
MSAAMMPAAPTSEPVLRVKDLRTEFSVRAGVVKAVDGVSFEVGRGRILGLVGESGSGKSVTGYSILGLIDPPGRIAAGEVLLNGVDVTKLRGDDLRRIRGALIAMVFQDPMMTLNPVLKVSTQMIAAVRAHDKVSRDVARTRARDALATVGIPSPEERLDAYPHQLSGGMRQRVAIAIALLHKPAVIIADEPTTALDVSIQSQILAEVRRLATDTGTAFIWITHDLAVVSSLADDICVMYAGRIVETGVADAVISSPRHPYTAGLLASVPAEHVPGSRLPQVPGSAPSLADLPPGCAFAPRCPKAGPACDTPPPVQKFEDGRTALCHYPITPDPR